MPNRQIQQLLSNLKGDRSLILTENRIVTSAFSLTVTPGVESEDVSCYRLEIDGGYSDRACQVALILFVALLGMGNHPGREAVEAVRSGQNFEGTTNGWKFRIYPDGDRFVMEARPGGKV